MNKDHLQYSIDNNLETIAEFERDIQNAEKQLLQYRRDYNTRSKHTKLFEKIEWLEKSGIPWLRETQQMIKDDVEIFRLQLTGMSYEEAVSRLQTGVEQGTLF